MTREPREKTVPGHTAIATKGWWPAHKWLLLRRASQVLVLALFLIGPLTGLWLVKGTLAYSMTLDFLPLTDPLVALQALVAGHMLESTALIGAAIVLVFYAVVGGRTYCSWVCPINVVSDGANWLRGRLGWSKGGVHVSRQARLWILGGVLVVSALTGVIAWEVVNPITILQRGIVFGSLFAGGLAWMAVLAVFLIELAGGNRLWCSHLCPVGAFYGLVGAKSLIRVSAARRDACDDCLDCYAVCPEAHVITPALKGGRHGRGPVILSPDCTNCGRCIDVCAPDVFRFASRFRNRPEDVEAVPQGKSAAGDGKREAA